MLHWLRVAKEFHCKNFVTATTFIFYKHFPTIATFLLESSNKLLTEYGWKKSRRSKYFSALQQPDFGDQTWREESREGGETLGFSNCVESSLTIFFSGDSKEPENHKGREGISRRACRATQRDWGDSKLDIAAKSMARFVDFHSTMTRCS